MKTLGQLTDEMKNSRDLWLILNKLACDAESVAEKARDVANAFEKEYEDAKRNVDMYEEDQIDLAESKKDLDEDMDLSDKLQG